MGSERMSALAARRFARSYCGFFSSPPHCEFRRAARGRGGPWPLRRTMGAVGYGEEHASVDHGGTAMRSILLLGLMATALWAPQARAQDVRRRAEAAGVIVGYIQGNLARLIVCGDRDGVDAAAFIEAAVRYAQQFQDRCSVSGSSARSRRSAHARAPTSLRRGSISMRWSSAPMVAFMHSFRLSRVQTRQRSARDVDWCFRQPRTDAGHTGRFGTPASPRISPRPSPA